MLYDHNFYAERRNPRKLKTGGFLLKAWCDYAFAVSVRCCETFHTGSLNQESCGVKRLLRPGLGVKV